MYLIYTNSIEQNQVVLSLAILWLEGARESLLLTTLQFFYLGFDT